MAGYTRQSTANIVAGQAINALPLANEFNAIEAAFHGTTGHAHDGNTGNGPRIDLTTSVSGILPVANGGTGTAGTGLTLTSTDAGAAAGPDLTLYRNSATPAANDLIGRFLLQGEDSAGNTEDYAEIYGRIDDTTSTSEDASLLFRTKVAGTMTTGLTLTGLTTHYPATSVQNWDSGDVTLTHSTNALAWAGATTYTFDTDLRITSAGTNSASAVTVGGTQTLTNKTLTSPTITGPTVSGTVALASGTVFNWNSGDVTLTHAANALTFAGATTYTFDTDLRITSAGTNSASAVTVGGTQTLTNKTLTSPTITTPTITLAQSASPSPTAEGDIQWDSDDHAIVVGDGSTSVTFRPTVAGTDTVSTSGTSVDFTGIPAWATEITIVLSGVSTNGTDLCMVQIGDAGGIETSSYIGSESRIDNTTTTTSNFSSGYLFSAGLAAAVRHGIITLRKVGSSTWIAAGCGGRSDTTQTWVMGGQKTTSAALDRVRITTTGGANTFDAGTISVSYR